jgi:hypothetical protein
MRRLLLLVSLTVLATPVWAQGTGGSFIPGYVRLPPGVTQSQLMDIALKYRRQQGSASSTDDVLKTLRRILEEQEATNRFLTEIYALLREASEKKAE